MSGKTKIEWATDQWNPVTGCSKVSQGCKHCYAEREWPRLAAPRAKPNIYTSREFTDVRCHPEKLEIPLHWQKPRRIFVNSMSDLFHEDVPDDFIDKVFAVMGTAHQHTFQVLTKRPRRMFDYLNGQSEIIMDARIEVIRSCAIAHGYTDRPEQDIRWPLPNVWLGISCEDQATADERIPLLLQTPAAVRWVSAEPLLGPINLRNMHGNPGYGTPPERDRYDALHPFAPWRLNWIVTGGESGPQARPMNPQWARDIRDQCQAAGVPFFHKQNGEFASVSEVEGPGWHCKFPDGRTVRRVGKKAAGRMLDGRTWGEYPECS